MKSLLTLFVCIVTCLTFTAHATPALAQNKTPSVKKTAKEKEKAAPQLSDERIQQLYAFVDAHHPELRKMLETLEAKRKRQYSAAMRGLDRSVKKVESIKKRSPNRYAFALNQWKLESRIKVVSAQLTFKDTEEDRERLEQLVTQLVDFHIKRIESERQQVRKRLEQLDKKIADAQAKRAETIAKRVKNASPKVKRAKKKD